MALRCDHLADHQAPGDLAPGGGGLRAAVVPSPRDRPPGAAGDRWPADPGAAASTRGRGATGTLDRAPRSAGRTPSLRAGYLGALRAPQLERVRPPPTGDERGHARSRRTRPPRRDGRARLAAAAVPPNRPGGRAHRRRAAVALRRR